MHTNNCPIRARKMLNPYIIYQQLVSTNSNHEVRLVNLLKLDHYTPLLSGVYLILTNLQVKAPACCLYTRFVFN